MRPVGLFGALALGAGCVQIGLVAATFGGAILFQPTVLAGLVGCVFLALAMWRGASRWLLLVLPVLLVPAGFWIYFFLACDHCIG